MRFIKHDFKLPFQRELSLWFGKYPDWDWFDFHMSLDKRRDFCLNLEIFGLFLSISIQSTNTIS